MAADPAAPREADTARGRFEDRPGRLVAEIDLSVEVTDTAGRHTSGRLVGTRNRLRLDVTDPVVVIGAAGRGATGGMAARLAEAGVRAELHGPRGRVARIDPGTTSRAGAMLAGSRHVTLDRRGWLLPVRALSPRVVSTAGGVAAAVVVAAVLAHSRRR